VAIITCDYICVMMEIISTNVGRQRRKTRTRCDHEKISRNHAIVVGILFIPSLHTGTYSKVTAVCKQR